MSPRLIVAVCTNRTPERISPTLEELSRQLSDVPSAAAVLVTSGVSSDQQRELCEIATEHGLGCVDEPRGGLSNARNAALAAAAETAEVVAYLDDDAIPAAGWLRNLAAHWEQAPAEVACIGGAIDPIWSADPPEWMSAEIGVVFSLLDRGPGTRPLKPGVEDAFGANVSFRVSALQEVGGFDPSLGPVANVPFFADETEAQRRLAELGYRGLYAGDARVGHVVGAERLRLREVLRRRFYAGAGMRRVGQWGVGAGLARLAAGIATAPLAFVTRRPESLAVAIGRIGTGAGVLAEQRVSRRLAALQEPRTGVSVALLHAHDLSEVRRGTERLVADLARRLTERGRRVMVISAHDGPATTKVRDGVPVILNRRPPGFGPLRRHELTHWPLSLRTLLCEGHVEVAHAFHPSDALAALAWGRRRDRPVVFTVPAYPPQDPGPLRRRVLKPVFERSSAVVAPTNSVADAIRSAFPGAHVVVIAPGVDTERFTPGGGRSETPMLFCAAHLLEPRKRVADLVRVFGQAREAIPDARLVLADPHPGRDLPEWTRDPGVELRPMHGDADLMAAYREAWCTVLPAVREPFGLVLSESMACGTPVLGADDGGIPEVIGGPPAGRVVDPEDDEAWVAALREVLAAPPSGEDAGRARARAEELSLDECVDAYERLYAKSSTTH